MSARNLQNNVKPAIGLSTDTHPINQPANTFRYALNMLLESREGDQNAITTEEGNIPCDVIKDGYRLIGTILINNNDVVLFSTNETKSEIGILTEGCVYTALIESTCLSFSRDYPIMGIYKIHNGCDRIIYFTDNFNPFRSINLDNLLSYTNLDMSGEHVSVTDANLNDDWNCDLFKHTLDYQVPTIDLNSVISGSGALLTGTYRFAIRYLDPDFNPTDWIIIENPIPISDGLEIIYNSVDGGNFDLTANPLFNTSKSIKLDISNLDSNFKYYQLAVLESNQGLENNFNIFALNIQTIYASTDSFTYSGFLSEKIEPLSIENLVVGSVSFNQVKALAQIDNRLVVANTSEDNKNWADFQKEASKIITNWSVFDRTKNDAIDYTGGVKSPHYTFEYKSYMRDEVYAFGIVYVFNDGTESPVFHIPGRPANVGVREFSGVVTTYTNQQLVDQGNATAAVRNIVPSITDGELTTDNWDTQLLTVVAASSVVDPKREVDERNVDHIPITEFTTPVGAKIGNTIERWKVYNTATLVGAYDGCMAYYECEETYPIITDCTGESIWGTDYFGNILEGTPIRHHKFPDTGIVDIHDGYDDPSGSTTSITTPNGDIWTMALNFTNVNYPVDYASDIQGYYIVRVKRDESNSTVLDKGVGLYVRGFTNGETGDTWNEVSVNGATRTTVFADTESIISVVTPRTQFFGDIVGTKYLKFEHLIDCELINPSGAILGFTDLGTRSLPSPDDALRQTSAYFYIDPGTVYTSPAGFISDFYGGKVIRHLVYRTIHDLVAIADNGGAVGPGYENWYVAIKQWNRPYGNLFNLQYQKANNNILTATGTGFSLQHRLFGGDCFIADLTFTVGSQTSTVLRGVPRNNFYCESYINSELRSHGTESWETHYRKFSGSNQDWRTLIDGDSNLALEYFNYNTHYSQENTEFQFFPLPIEWDYCYNCNNKFPYRIHYSERAYQEQRADNYKQFLANNYRDLQGDTGEINKLFVYKDELYAQADQASWFVPTKPQQLTTNEGNIEVGTGDILSIPPKRLETTERGYAGTKDPFATVVSEFGAFFVDSDAGKIFLLQGGQGLKDVTLKGMRNWFAENLPLKIREQIPDFNLAITAKNGAGLQAVLDPRHNRIILYKRDYRLIGDALTVHVSNVYEDPTPFAYGFNTETGEFYSWLVDTEVIENIQGNVELVEDLSWTISFSLMHESWASYHSYKPEWMWNNRNNFYTYKYSATPNENYTWKHGSKNYNQFYGTSYPSVVEVIFNENPTITKTFNALAYISKAEQPIANDFVEVPYETFTKAFLYNSKQSSGLLNIVPKQLYNDSDPFIELDYDYSTIYARENEDTWNISEFYNMVIDNTVPLVTTDWNDPDFQTAKIATGILSYPNSSATDFAKGDFLLEPLRDKWLALRMWYDNPNSYKLTTEFISSLSNVSFK